MYVSWTPTSNYVPTYPESAKSVQHASAGEPEMNKEIDCENVPFPLEDSINQAIFCHLNIQSLINKMDELCSVLTVASWPVVFGISETWLDHSISNGEVSIPPYVLHQRDRGSRGGGILAYSTASLRSQRREDLETKDL